MQRPPIWGIAVVLVLWGVVGTAAWYGYWWPLIVMGALAVVAGGLAVGAALMVRGSARRLELHADKPGPPRHVPSGPRAPKRKRH